MVISYKWDKDVYHYLDNIAAQNDEEKRRGVCHRAIRAMVSIWKVKSKDGLTRCYLRNHFVI